MKEKNCALVTILMPVYNRERYIRQAIDGALSQTYTNFELFIINDCSTDRSEEIILSFKDSRIRYILNNENIGNAASSLKALSLAKGKYVARMDDDDVSLPNRIQDQVRYLETHPNLMGCCSDEVFINSNGEKIGQVRHLSDSELISCKALFTMPVSNASMMFRRDALDAIPYNADIRGAGQDYEVIKRMCARGMKFSCLRKFLVEYRKHETNISNCTIEKGIRLREQYVRVEIESFLGRNITENELGLHLCSYFPLFYQKNRKEERQWLVMLFQHNNKVKRYGHDDFAAFLFSRWVVYCIVTKKLWNIPFVDLPIYNPRVFYKTIKLFMFK